MTVPEQTSSTDDQDATSTTLLAAPEVGGDGTWPMPEGSGPCRTWPLAAGCGCISRDEVADPATADATKRYAVELATEMVWRLTAGRFGLCAELIRPCRRCTCNPCTNGLGFRPELHGGDWSNQPCQRCHDTTGTCGCPDPPVLALPGPVHHTPLTAAPDPDATYRAPDADPATQTYRLTVWLDGHALTPNTYTLYDRHRLARLDGGVWPTCQNLTAPLQPREAYPDEATGTFGVQYWRGTPVPPGGQRAVAVLACELYKACTRTGECRLPGHVQSITREGVSYQMLDTADYTAQGRMGIPEVDTWLSAVNPRGQRSPSAVYSPDLPAAPWTPGPPGGGAW